jgi:alpha-glucosidase
MISEKVNFTNKVAYSFFISSRFYGCLIEFEGYSRFEFGSHFVSIKIADSKVQGRFFIGDNPKQIIQEYTGYCGRMEPLPEWAMEGVILGIQGGISLVENILNQTLDACVAVATLWLQDWCGKRTQTILGRKLKRLWWNWESDERYPNWENFIKELEAKNMKIISYVNSLLHKSVIIFSGKCNYIYY